MQVEVGDYIQHTWDEHCGVVVRVVKQPLNMGEHYEALNTRGEVEVVEYGNFVCNYGMTRSQTHRWSKGEQAEYNSLHHNGRRLYDQIRTRLSLGHADAYLHALEAFGTKADYQARLQAERA